MSPTPVFRHEINGVGGSELGRNDDVALVLAILGVHEDVHASLPCFLEYFFGCRNVSMEIVRSGQRGCHQWAIPTEMVGAGCKQASRVSNINGADTDIYLNLIGSPNIGAVSSTDMERDSMSAQIILDSRSMRVIQCRRTSNGTSGRWHCSAA
jgi:hypothetical protein